jgi:hypothetical protein
MKRTKHFALILLLMVFGVSATTASATPIAYVSLPTATNGSSSIPTGTTYTSNLGYAFKTGSSGPFDIDWINLGLVSSATSGSGTFEISINGTDNETPLLAVASSTVYAADTVSFTTPGTASTPFDLILNAADLPNISAYSLLPNTAYSLFVNSATGSSIALRRVQGLASGSDANAAYAVTNGFTMLDTFRNNIPNYSNSAGPPVSYAVFAMSFGFEAVPEPSTYAMALTGLACGGYTMFRRRKRA